MEAKVSVGFKPLNYRSGLRDHQVMSLINFNTRSVAWKISDAAMTTQMCDAIFSHPDTTCGIFVFHWVRPKNKEFFVILPELIQAEIDSGSKSLTEDRARSIATLTGMLK